MRMHTSDHSRHDHDHDINMTSHDVTCDIMMLFKGYDVQDGLEV